MQFRCGPILAGALLALGGCGASGKAQLTSKGGTLEGSHALSSGNFGASARKLTRDMNVEDLKQGDPSLSLGDMRLKPEVCEGTNPKPEYRKLGVEDLEAFLNEHGIRYEKVRARPDLHYLDLVVNGAKVRLRVATLSSAHEAAVDLHQAILQHGPGSWGVRRSNLAVLAPIADADDMIGFAAATKLACWGLLTAAGRDDSFVIPGGSFEM